MIEPEDSGCAIWLVFAGFLVGGLVGGCTAKNAKQAEYQQQAIDRGVARYHPLTGEWEWTIDVPVEKEETE